MSKLERKNFKIAKLIINSVVAGILEIVSLASSNSVLHVVLKSDLENSQINLFIFILIVNLPDLNNTCFFIIIFLLKIFSFF